MPPPLPDRYRLEVRIGRDGDVEEWLATDTSLDRPVLIRLLGPDTGPDRRRNYLEAVRAAAGVNHPHLAAVFTAGEVPDGAFAVSEWTGAVSLSDRLDSDQTVDPDEFLANAAGLAGALAALHREGVVHGAIDTGAIFYAIAHPAKLGSFGRVRRDSTAMGDVRALANALEEGLTGAPPGGPPPSEVVDGLSRTVDRALRRAQTGHLTARALADELAGAPTPVAAVAEPPGWSRRLLVTATALVAAALGLIGLGRLFLSEGGDLAFPDMNGPEVAPAVSEPAPAPESRLLEVAEVAVFDPYGGGDERDELLPHLVDGDLTTAWATERYRDPLPAIKPGVGVSFEIVGRPSLFEAVGISSGVSYRLWWSESAPSAIDDWELVATGATAGRSLTLQVPPRTDGRWLLWFVDLPPSGEAGYSAEVAEVRFQS